MYSPGGEDDFLSHETRAIEMALGPSSACS